jgi:hypothetical protein
MVGVILQFLALGHIAPDIRLVQVVIGYENALTVSWVKKWLLTH